MTALNFVADVGQVMLESSSSVSQVTTRLRGLLVALDLPDCSMDADLSSLVLSCWRPDFDVPITTIRDIQDASPRGGVGISGSCGGRTLGLSEAAEELDDLRRPPDTGRRFV